ncbi:MAG: alcohol dehydrogenase catalytic domain-containing protein [Bryobacterales bacterium]|nr:alcohol dehydrogenase catalytic domain-containing protein [Bryobacterales bacterium]
MQLLVADVVEAEDSSWVGRRVVGEINLACGSCSWCARGLGRHCPKRSVLGIVKHPGAFAEFLTLPMANLHLVPHPMADEVAVFAEPVAAACEILEQLPIASGTPVAVLGDGKLGLLIAMVLQLHGARVDLYGRHPEKMAIAAELGVEPRSAGAAGRQYPIVVDATGSEQGLAAAIAMTEARGTVVMKSTVSSRVSIDMASVIVPEITLVGSRCGSFLEAIPLLLAGMLPVEKMIQGSYPLKAAPAAFEHAARKGTLKIVLRP